jgi:hypothetical protein
MVHRCLDGEPQVPSGVNQGRNDVRAGFSPAGLPKEERRRLVGAHPAIMHGRHP